MFTTAQGWTAGLGSSGTDTWTPDWTVIGSMPNSTVVLLQSQTPEGIGFVVVNNHGSPIEATMFPNDTLPSSSGKQYSLDADEAFAAFERITTQMNSLVGARGSSDRAQTFDELDARLIAMDELPQDIVFELQKKGKSPDGGRKTNLNLSAGATNRIPIVSNDNAWKLAKMHYKSYPADTRINALRDCNINVLARYMDPELISQLIARNRAMAEMYRKLRSQGNAYGKSLEAFLTDVEQDTVPVELPDLMPPDPLIAVTIKFEDQNGIEIKKLPYRIAVRGAANFNEARIKTKMGTDPGSFGSGQTLYEDYDPKYPVEGPGWIHNGYDDWKGQRLRDTENPWHFMFAYKATGKVKDNRYPWPRGNVKISVLLPENTNDEQSWGNNRLFTYNKSSSLTVDRTGDTVKGKPLQVLSSHNMRLNNGQYTRLTITVPIYREPLPMHLVEHPPNSGQTVLRWQLEPKIENIPEHQKVELQFLVTRPKANDRWEGADKVAPPDRPGYNDKYLQYDEFTSDAGRAAVRAGVVGARPVPGMKFMFKPAGGNEWAAAKTSQQAQSGSINGSFSLRLVPGEYEVIRLQDLNADGSTALIESDAEYAVAFTDLNAEVRASLTARTGEPPADKMFAPVEYPVGRVRVPGGFYYRKPDERDTTPLGVVGAEMLNRSDISNSYAMRMTGFQLNAAFPPLPPNKKPLTDTIYATLALVFPEVETQGWPISGKKTNTSELLFDTAQIVLMDDSSVDLSRLGEYERRYEAERDGTSVLTPPPVMPRIGERIEFKGYWIERSYYDTSYDINPKGTQWAAKIPHDYNMGKLPTAYNAPGVVEIVGYYPVDGSLTRQITFPYTYKESHPWVDKVAVFKERILLPSYADSQLFSYDKMSLSIVSSLEGAILTGRFVALQDIGQGYAMNTPEEAMKRIMATINRGGGPIEGGQSYTQFWSGVEDWFFKQIDRDNNPAPISYDALQEHGSDLMNKMEGIASDVLDIRFGGTTAKIENTEGDDDNDFIFAPLPDDDDDDMGMVSW